MGNKEKVKAYGEDIERTNKSHDNEITEEIFPELKENKDERIKKAIIEFFESEDDNTTYSLVRKKDIIDWLEKQRDKDKLIQELGEYKVKYTQEVLEKYVNSMSNKDDERLRKTAIAFLKDFAEQGYENAVECIAWLEKQGEQNLPSVNERAWLYLVSDVLTWKDGIGQYLDDPRVQEFTKRLCNYYAQKLYKPSNIEKNEQKPADKIEPRFKVGDWVIFTTSGNKGNLYQVEKKGNYEYTLMNNHGCSFCLSFSNEELIREWTIQDANDGDIIHFGTVTAIFKKYIGREKCICYCSFCKDGGFEIPIENGEDNVYGCYNATPATKEQRDVLIKAMNDAGYKWDIETNTLEKLAEPKFDPKTLQPFDKVLVRNFPVSIWQCGIFSHQHFHQYFVYNDTYKFCIPYNNDTKHLIGTTDEAPEYYRYWED